eukprot:192027_1
MVQFTAIFPIILFLSVLDLYTIAQPDYIIISFQQKHATQRNLPSNCACYYTTNNTECIAMNSSEFRNDAMNKHSRSSSVKLARDNIYSVHQFLALIEDALPFIAITNSHRMKDCIAYYGTHVAATLPLSRSQSRMLLPIRHANSMGLSLTTDRYRC